MNTLTKYIIKNLSQFFISIFLPLYAIASVIFMIKLATYTAVIQLTILDMTKLYLFILPEILFFTLPISFFVASALALFKLSNDNEIIVLFSLGIKPRFLLKVLLKPAFFLSMILLLDFFVLIPHTSNISKNFLNHKKSEAKFNLSASEFGHKFGDWLLYLGEDNLDGTFSNVYLFNKNKKEEVLIAANRAKIINYGGILKLKLSDGEGYSYSKEKFTQINFKTMFINDSMTTNYRKYEKTLEYWRSDYRAKNKKSMFIVDFLIALLPILGLFLVAAIGIVHARHSKVSIYLLLFIGVAVYYGLTLGLKAPLGFLTIPIVFVVWLSGTYYLYYRNILKRF
jgi:lipopolysaccharide export system permease protein